MNAFERWQEMNAKRVEARRLEDEKYARWQQLLYERQQAIPMRGRGHMRPTINGIPIVEDPLTPPGQVYLLNTQYMGYEPAADFTPGGGDYGGAGASADWTLPGESSTDTSSTDSGGGSSE